MIFCIFLENKIAHHYSFDLLNKLMSHGLTLGLIMYTILMTMLRTTNDNPDVVAEKKTMI